MGSYSRRHSSVFLYFLTNSCHLPTVSCTGSSIPLLQSMSSGLSSSPINQLATLCSGENTPSLMVLVRQHKCSTRLGAVMYVLMRCWKRYVAMRMSSARMSSLRCASLQATKSSAILVGSMYAGIPYHTSVVAQCLPWFLALVVRFFGENRVMGKSGKISVRCSAVSMRFCAGRMSSWRTRIWLSCLSTD